MPGHSATVRSTNEALARAEALLAVNRFDEAAAILQSAIASETSDPRPRNLLAAALIDRRRFRDGLREADRAIGVAPDNSTGHRLRAHALLELRRHRQALKAATESLRLDPEGVDSFVVLAEIQLAMRNLDVAERSAHEAVRLEPDDAHVLDLLGRVALIKRKLPEAENYFRAALALEPNRWQTLNNLSVALLQQGRAAEAAASFQTAVRLQPQDPVLRSSLANLTGPETVIGAVLVSWVTLSLLAQHSFGLPPPIRALVSVLVIAACVALIVRALSRRNQFVGRLSAPTMILAEIERKSRRRRHDQRAAFTTGAPVALWIVGAVTSLIIGSGLPLLLAFVVGLTWMFVAPSIWRRRVLPRLEDAEQSKRDNRSRR